MTKITYDHSGRLLPLSRPHAKKLAVSKAKGEAMIEETGFHDVRGIPICVGDLIRVKHFKHYRRRKQIWLYFIVRKLSGRAVVFNYGDSQVHQCLLVHCGIESAEVLAGESYQTAEGELVMWCERKRKAKQ